MVTKPKKKVIKKKVGTNGTNGTQLQVFSSLLSRAVLASSLGKAFGTDRDYYATFGYKKNPSFTDYYARYRRQDVAGRIVDLPAQSTWRSNPKVLEDESAETQTEFETVWEKMVKRLRIWHMLERADRLAGIGRYGVMVIGTRGGNLNTPLRKMKREADVTYLAPFSEDSCTVKSLVKDLTNPRYGQPSMYELTLLASQSGDPNDGLGRANPRTSAVEVHWTRIIHLAEGLEENFIYGRPRLERVYNLFDDLVKVTGGSAEMFWLSANRGMQVDIDSDSELDPSDETALDDEIKEYQHGLRRFIRTKGVNINALPGAPIDPRGIFNVLMSLISGATGIPQRIFMGSERGELASSQDRNNWAERIKERQQTHAEPMILRPFIDRLIEFGALPTPGGEYFVQWPDLFAISDNERAQIAARNSKALFDITKALDSRQDLFVPSEIRPWFGLPSEVPKTGQIDPPTAKEGAGNVGTPGAPPEGP